MTDLLLIHIIFIAARVGCSWYWGRKEGAQKVLQMLIDDRVITAEDLERYTITDDQIKIFKTL